MPCTLDILTEANYLTDWFVDNDSGTCAIVGNQLEVDLAGGPSGGSSAHIFRFVDVPRAQVLAGVMLDCTFGYTADDLLDPSDGLTINAEFQITGSNSSRRRALVGQIPSIQASANYWAFIANQALANEQDVAASDIVDAASNTFRQTISAVGGSSELLEQGIAATFAAPTIPAGDPLTLRIGMNIAMAPTRPPDNATMHAWIGTPVLRDLVSGDPIEIEGLQHCSEPCGCLPHVCPDLAVFDDFSRTVSPNSFGNASSGPTWARGPGTSNGQSYVNPGAGVMQNNGGPFVIFEEESVDLGITPGADFAVEVSGGLSSDTEVFSVQLSLDSSSVICGWGHDGSGDAEIRLQPGGSAPLVAPISNTFWSSLPDAGVFKVQRKQGVLYFKLYDALGPEPGWMLAMVDTGSPSPGDPGLTLQSSMNTSDLAGGQQVAFTLIRVGDPCEEPSNNQPIEDELVGIGDGSTTAYFTRWPYVANSLEVEVAPTGSGGVQSDFDPTDWRTGEVAVLPAPGSGDRVTVSYRRAVP